MNGNTNDITDLSSTDFKKLKIQDAPYITKKMLEDIIGEVMIDKAIIEPDPNLRPKAPGMKYTHYAPKGEVSIVEYEPADMKEDYQFSAIDVKTEKVIDDEIK